ncbi:MAG: CPBP family intramembrane metalloprotease [Lachnospiraceae bacterium]|nr:CPBP family intramembrane metalloprotease [Lachnospiraceae bacterium]
MSGRKRYRLSDWMGYLFNGTVPEEDDEAQSSDAVSDTDEGSADEGSSKAGSGKKKKKRRRRGIDDEDPVSFRTVTGPLSVQQILYYVFRDLFYASGPMITYIVISLLCILIGYPLSGMARFSFTEYLDERSNIMVAVGVVLTLRHLYKKSKQRGSAFFEDASLYRKNVSWKKIVIGFAFGAGAALFLSSVLTLIPKVWIFAVYSSKVDRIYKRYDILLTIVESAVLTPLVEEIIFRGYMLNRLLRRWFDLPAMLVTTLIFSLMHGSSIWFIYAFAMGWVIGKISVREGNILYGIFIHAGFNLPSVVQWFIWFMHPELQNVGVATNVFQTILLGIAGCVVAFLTALLYRRQLSDMEV